MPTIQESILARLLADAAITALVIDRIYPDDVPDGTLTSPFVYYAVTDSKPLHHLKGQTFSTQNRVEFEILADTYAEMEALKDAVRTSLNGWAGGQVQRALWAGASSGTTQGGFHATLSFDVFGVEGTVVPVSAGLPRVEVRSDGLYFGGVKIGDLSGYATENYVDTVMGGYLPLTGGILTGSVYVGSAANMVFTPNNLILESDGPANLRINAGPVSDERILTLLPTDDFTLTISGNANISGTNTGNQTSIVGITGSLAQFNAALTGADFATGGGVVTGTCSGVNSGDQDLSGYLPNDFGTITTDGGGAITAAQFTGPLFGNADTATSATTAPLGGITGLGVNVATFLASPNSANLRAALTDEAGTGPALFSQYVHAYWPLSEVSGALRVSAYAPGQDLASSGTVGQATGVGGTGKSASFSGRAYLRTTSYNTDRWSFAGKDWTITGWFYFNSTGLASLCGTVAGGLLVGARTNQIECRLFQSSSGGGNFATVAAPYTQAAATWYFVCVRFNTTTRVLSVSINNGTPVTGTLTGSQMDTGDEFTIGTNLSGFGDLTGRAQSIGVFASQPGAGGRLTDSQVTTLYGGGTPPGWPVSGV